MRKGFTTGSCAAAAAKAASYMLLTGRRKETITIETPKGITYHAAIEEIQMFQDMVSCSVKKDGGDDPDVTTGMFISAKVEKVAPKEKQKIWIDGGIGVGRVTKPGLDQPVNSAAINHVPREMIEKEVKEVCELLDYKGGLKITIFAKDGEKIAKHTFNEKLGIIGGISILGTTGIVEPMSAKALLDTIQVEIHQKKELGYKILPISPGNYGLDYLKKTYGYDLNKSVKSSNFIGQTLDMAIEEGFEKILLTGHIGKLVKLAGYMFNTHSKEGDCRMELLASACIKAHVPIEVIEQLLDSVTTEDALSYIEKTGKMQVVMEILLEKIQENIQKRIREKASVELIIYSNILGELIKSKNAKVYIDELIKGE